MIALSLKEVQERIDKREDGEWVDLAGCEIIDFAFGHSDNTIPLKCFDFRRARLIRCSFTNSYFRDVKCQGSKFINCDLRYADIERTSFKQAVLEGCDLYRARLGPNTIFESADVSYSSLNLALFDGVTLPRRVITGGINHRLLQEQAKNFEEFHKLLASMGLGDNPVRIPLHLSRRHREAADIYRSLSAHWASKGSTRDAGWAYYQARRLETQSLRPDIVWRRRCYEREFEPEMTPPGLVSGTLSWMAGTIADLVAGFGESPLRVVATIFIVSLAFALLYLLTSVSGQAGDPLWLRVTDALLFSAQAMTASLDNNLNWRWLKWVVTLETTLGITLLGLLGFCLGVRLRSS